MSDYQLPTIEIDGWMMLDELHHLYNWASNCDSVVEIGSWKGRSTHALCSACKGTVYAVDHFLGSEDLRDNVHAEAKRNDISEIFRNNMKDFNNLEVIKMSSEDAASLFPNKSIDMVFIDGCHTYDAVKNDVSNWLPKCKKIICGHDLVEPGVKNALDDLNIKYMSFGTALGLWYAEVKN
jgi:hypothetical protein